MVLLSTYDESELSARARECGAIAAPGVSEKALARRVSHVLPAGIEAVTGKALAKEASASLSKGLGLFNKALLVFAGVALFVGSFIISVVGAALRAVLGVGLGIAMTRALADQGIESIAIPGTQLLVAVVLAGVAGVVAGIGPARRAAKVDVLRAVVTD